MGEILIDNVGKSYPRAGGGRFEALSGIRFGWRAGQSIAVCGESGSGKSTLARIVLGLERPTAGDVVIDGTATSGLGFRQWRPYRRLIQGVFQDASGTLNPQLSVYRNMEEALVNLTNLNARQRRREIGLLTERLGLDGRLLRASPRELSGGEQRKASLIRALAVKPSYLVLDEVLSGLDLLSADAMLATLEEYRRGFGCAYLLITHDWPSAYRLTDTILVLDQGKLTRKGVKNEAKSSISGGRLRE